MTARLRRPAVPLAAIVVALSCCIGVAGAAPSGWSEPEDLSDNFEVSVLEGSAYNFPQLAVSGSGDAIVVWQRQEQLPDLSYRQEIWSRERVLGGAWGPARYLGPGTDPDVAMDAGTTVVAWQAGTGVVARVRRAGGDYSLPKGFGEGTQVQAGVDDSGAAVILWSASGIRAARNTAAAGWSATRTISTSPTAQNPDLSVSGSGDAIATWSAQDGVRVTEFTPATGWSAHHLVGPGGLRPSIAANDEGRVVLAWALPGPPPDPGGLPTQSVRGTTGTIRGGLEGDVPLSDPLPEDLWLHWPTPEAAIGDRGDVVVAWNRALFPRYDSTVQVVTRQIPYAWSYPSSISVPVLVPRPSLAVLADGTAIATWRGGSAAVRPADQADWLPSRWDPPFVLSGPAADVYNPQVAADDAGRLHVAWADVSRPQTRYDDHLAFMAIQATSFGLPGTPPTPQVPSAPGTSTGGGSTGNEKARTAIPKMRFSVAVRRGRLVLLVRATLPRSVAGRTLVIQRRARSRTLALATVKVPAHGRISKTVPLAARKKSGATGVKGASAILLRATIAASPEALAASSPYKRVSIPAHLVKEAR